MINIVHFCATDLKGISEGGIASYIREIMKQSGKDARHVLAGVSKKGEYKTCAWTEGSFANTKFGFFSVLEVSGEHITYEKGVPLTLSYVARLFKYRSRIIEGADSLHFHRVELALPFILFFKRHLPIAATIHGNNYDVKLATKHPLFKRRWVRFLFHKLETFIIRRIDKVIFVSADAIECYSEKIPDQKHKFVFIPICVDLYLFKPMEKNACRSRYGIDTQSKVILFAGRMHEQKGLDLLLGAYANCRKTDSGKFLLMLAGDGIERNRLQDRVSREGLEPVIFLGNVAHDQLPGIMNCADVFVLPSLWEGMPYVVIEALSCGVPVVATNVGQTGQIVKNGVNGFMLDSRNAAELCDRILRAIDAAGTMKEKCVESVAGFSSTEVVRNISKLHESLVDIYKTRT